MWPYGDSQHGSLGSHLGKFQGICFEYEESVTWTGAMVPVLQPGGSGLETAEERCHLARVLIFSQLSTGKGVQPSALVWHVQCSVRNSGCDQEGDGFVVSRNKLCLVGTRAHIHPLEHSD